MIPREIFKKIRQIEIRRNRIVTETNREVLFQPLTQFRRISRVMPKCANNHLGFFFVNHKEDGIRPRFWKPSLAGQAADQTISFRALTNDLEEVEQVAGKPLAYSWLSPIVEINSLNKFLFCFLLNDNLEAHPQARNRFSISATTSSSGRQNSGCARACSARRSSSAIS